MFIENKSITSQEEFDLLVTRVREYEKCNDDMLLQHMSNQNQS